MSGPWRSDRIADGIALALQNYMPAKVDAYNAETPETIPTVGTHGYSAWSSDTVLRLRHPLGYHAKGDPIKKDGAGPYVLVYAGDATVNELVSAYKCRVDQTFHVEVSWEHFSVPDEWKRLSSLYGAMAAEALDEYLSDCASASVQPFAPCVTMGAYVDRQIALPDEIGKSAVTVSVRGTVNTAGGETA